MVYHCVSSCPTRLRSKKFETVQVSYDHHWLRLVTCSTHFAKYFNHCLLLAAALKQFLLLVCHYLFLRIYLSSFTFFCVTIKSRCVSIIQSSNNLIAKFWKKVDISSVNKTDPMANLKRLGIIYKSSYRKAFSDMTINEQMIGILTGYIVITSHQWNLSYQTQWANLDL